MGRCGLFSFLFISVLFLFHSPASNPVPAQTAQPACLSIHAVCIHIHAPSCPHPALLSEDSVFELNKALTSHAMSWVAYLCLGRSLSPLTRFCLVLAVGLMTGCACSSMWPRLLASAQAVVRAVTQSEQVNSTREGRGASCNNIRPLERVLSYSVYLRLPQLLPLAYKDASWQAAGLFARSRTGSTRVKFLSVWQSWWYHSLHASHLARAPEEAGHAWRGWWLRGRGSQGPGLLWLAGWASAQFSCSAPLPSCRLLWLYNLLFLFWEEAGVFGG